MDTIESNRGRVGMDGGAERRVERVEVAKATLWRCRSRAGEVAARAGMVPGPWVAAAASFAIGIAIRLSLGSGAQLILGCSTGERMK